MMLEHLGLKEEGGTIRKAVSLAIDKGIVTEDLAGKGDKAYSTTEVGNFVAENI